MSRCCPGGASTSWASIMLCAGSRNRLIYSRFDTAFGLAANGGQFRDDEIAGAFEHTLLTKRERLDIAEIGQMLQHVRHFKNIAGTHFFRKLFEAILPIISGRGEIICQGFEEHVTLA